jgi:hypothetical protein
MALSKGLPALQFEAATLGQIHQALLCLRTREHELGCFKGAHHPEPTLLKPGSGSGGLRRGETTQAQGLATSLGYRGGRGGVVGLGIQGREGGRGHGRRVQERGGWRWSVT